MAILIRSGYSAFSYDYTFSTWGSQFGSLGDAGFNYERFFGIGGDQPLTVPFSIGGPVNVWLPFIGDTELFRARLFGELGATFGINIIAEMNLGQPDPLNPDEPTPGSIEVVLPYALSYAFPILDPVLDDGDIIDLYFDASFEPGPGAGFQTLFPSLVFELQLVAGLDVLLGAEFGVLGKNRTITVLDFSADTVVPLVSIDTARKDALGDADPVNLFGVTTQELIEDIPGIEPAFDFNGEFAGIKIPFNQFFSAPKTKEKPKAETETSGSNPPEEEQREPPDPAGLDLGSIELLIPNINTVSTYADGIFVTDPNRRLLNGVIVDVDNTNNPLNAGNRADIAALTLDIDGILTYATGGAFPPLEYNFPPIGGSVAGANFSAAFSYNLFDVELRAGLPLVQEFTMTPALDTRLKFFEVNLDGSKSDTAKAVEVVQIVKALLFDENGTFQSDEVAARLQQLAAGNERVAQDVDLFVDFAAGIPGAFTGQTASIGGRMVVSRDDGNTWTELFTNAGEPIALSAPILGEDQTVELDLSGITFGYKIFRDDAPADASVTDEIYVIDFDATDSIYRLEERTQISALFETPFLDELDTLNLKYDGAQTYVEVENRVKPTITNRTGLEFDLSLLLQGLAASADFYASVDLGPVTIGGGFSVELGPLFSKRFPLFNADIVDFYNNSFQLTQSRTDSFVLGGIAPESSYGSAIVGTAGDDTDLRGTEGNDTLIGLAGNDNLYGEAGDDVLFGGLGNNFIYGGADYDTADFTDLPSILISLNNTVRDGYRNGDRAGVLANLAVDFFYVETVDSEGRRVHKSSLHEIERLRLTDSKDRFTMTVMGDLQQHVQIPEVIELLEGDDSAYIRVQNTDLEARGLTLLAGKGDDTVVVYMLNGYTTDWSQFLFDGGEGIDSLIITDLDDNNWSRFVDLSTGNAAGAQIRNFEDVRIDGITGLDYSITGNELDNVLGGGNGNDVIRGLVGNDILNGNAGDDLLIGGPGADQINGGSGYDTVSFADAPTSVYITFANGAMRGYRGEAQGDVYTGIERFVGSAFDDIMIGFGGAYRLEGGDGNDRLMGQAGNDQLIGGRGDDLLAAFPTTTTTQTFNNLYDGGEGFDIAAFSVWEPFTQTSSITGKGTYTYREGSTFSSSSTSSVRNVTVDIRYLRSAHVDVTLDENGDGLVWYVEDDAESRVYATDISGSAIYSHAEPRSIADLFPPYRTKTVSFDNNITDQLLPNLLNDSISFTRDSNLSNNNGTGKITATGSLSSAVRGGQFASEQLYGIEGLIGSKGNDKLNGNNQDNALFGGGGADLIKSGGGNDRLGFGEGQPLADVFSFPGDNGASSPNSNSTVYLTLEQRLQYINPEGTEEFRFGINLAPVGKIIINAAGATQDVGSFLWGQSGIDTLDMRHDRGISFFPDYSDNYAVVDLNIAIANAPINNFTGERIQYGRAEWFNGDGVRQSFATTFGVENIIGSIRNDRLTGDRNDNVIEGHGGADIMDGDAGFDTLSYSLSPEGVTLQLLPGFSGIAGLRLDNRGLSGNGHEVGDTAVNFEKFVTTRHADQITVSGAGAIALPALPAPYQNYFADRVPVPPLADLPILDLGDGDDTFIMNGGPRMQAMLGDGADTAVINGIVSLGLQLDAGEGDDVITIQSSGRYPLFNVPEAERTVFINGGDGLDTVSITGTAIDYIELTAEGARIYERTNNYSIYTYGPPDPFGSVFQFPSVLLSEAEAQPIRDALVSDPVVYQLTNIEFIDIGGERIRLDGLDPVVDADKTLTLQEDAREPFKLGVAAEAFEIGSGALFRVVELPVEASIGLPGQSPLAVGDLFAAADLEQLLVTAGQQYGLVPASFVYSLEGGSEPDRIAYLPEQPPLAGVWLGLTAPVDPLGGDLTITVTELPTSGSVFYYDLDPDMLALGFTVLTETVVGLGDILTPEQVKALFYQPGTHVNGAAGAFAYVANNGLGFRELAGTSDAEVVAPGIDISSRDGKASQRIVINITPVDDAPGISRLLYPLSPGGELLGQIVADDPEGDAFTLAVVDAPTLGSLALNADGSFIYRQNATIDFVDENGEVREFIDDLFTVQATQTSDGLTSLVRPQTVRIINPDFLAPIIFDTARPEVFFDENGLPVKLGGLGTDDTMMGHEGHDELFGFGGNDRIIGKAGNDRLEGGDGDDTLIGVDPEQLNPGQGEIDTLYGQAGRDTFVLGDLTWQGYDDLDDSSAGLDDYALIKDFTPGEDILQLHGTAGMYWQQINGNELQIFIDKPGAEPNELIAILENQNGQALGAESFRYMNDADGDGVPDHLDNAINVANPDQRDTDGDGYGNSVDPDFNNDGIVNFADLANLRQNFFSNDANADLDGSGSVNFADLAILKSLFFQGPGPSYIDGFDAPGLLPAAEESIIELVGVIH